MSLVIKAAFIKGDETSEFRRFTVDENFSYEFLKRKITEIFTDKCELMWKDADGDLVSFSSDEELQEALEGVSDGIFRMFVTVDQQQYLKSVPQLKYCNTINKHKKGSGRRLHKAQMKKSPDFDDDHNNGRSIFKGRPDNHEPELEHMGFYHRRHRNRMQRKSNEEMEAWFNRRQQKWLNRQQEMKESSNTGTEDNNNENGENDRLQKRIWRLRNKLALLKMGDLTPETTNQERNKNSGPPLGTEKVDREKFGRQQGKFGGDKHNAVIKLKQKNQHRARSCPGRITETLSRAAHFGRFNAGRRFGKLSPHHHTAECHGRRCRNGDHGEKHLRNGPFKKMFKKMFIELQDKPDVDINDDKKTNRRCRRQENLEKKIHFRRMLEENKKIPIAWRVKQRGLGHRHGRGMNYWTPRRMRLINTMTELEEEKNLIQSELKHGCRHTPDGSTDCIHKVLT